MTMASVQMTDDVIRDIQIRTTENLISGAIQALVETSDVRVSGVDVNDDGSVVILWEPIGDDDERND